VLRKAAALLALGLAACSGPASLPSRSWLPHGHLATPSPPAVQPRRALPSLSSAHQVALELNTVESAIRDAATPESKLAGLGRRQQEAYFALADHPEWVPAVDSALTPTLRPAVDANLKALSSLSSLNGTAGGGLPHWRIVHPAPVADLMSYYHEAEQAHGVPWTYLAAINFVETNFGRIVGDSSTGAQGPMQFEPPTWAEYGQGDVHDPHDAILAAARYLKAAGAPRDMATAVYAYNPDDRYVTTVSSFAGVLQADPRAYLGYYEWQVVIATSKGRTILPEGWSN
jgi:membrane-bound lytic murein transglycosylase B